MRNNRITKLVFSILLGMSFFSSCTKNDDNTIVLIGEEFYIDDILTVIPDTLKPEFDAVFGSIPEGPVPPKIEGNFVVDPKQRVSTNINPAHWPLTLLEPNMYLEFSEQNNGVVMMNLRDATDQITDTVFVMGNGNAFTVYFVENKSYDVDFGGQMVHVKMKRGVVMKGSVAPEGLADFKMASIIMKVEDDAPQGLMTQYAPGSYFVYRDGNGMADRLDE